MIKEIDAKEALEDLKKGESLFLDIRDPHSFEAAHIPNALHLNSEVLEDFLKKTARDKKVIVYCYHGISSQGAALYLQEQGFQDVYSLRGGFEEWNEHA